MRRDAPNSGRLTAGICDAGLDPFAGSEVGAPLAQGEIVDIERVARALQDARIALQGPRADDAQASIASALRSIAEAEQALGSRATALQIASHGNAEHRVQELEQKLAAQDEFASALAHELRNLLAPIVMQAEYLLNATQQGGTPLSAEWLGTRLAAFCRRLRKFVELFNRIMDASRVKAGRLSLELEDVDLSAVVHEVCASFDREAASARSTLSLSVPAQLPGYWDRLRLEQICTNLVSNAIRYGAGLPIEITASSHGEWAELRVRDHGIGIDPNDQQRIFERFERAGQRRNTGGFGIGLWIVRENCRALGGTVEVQSTPCKGSTFMVRLPRRVKTHGD
jgi:signal transduction histidine kinase